MLPSQISRYWRMERSVRRYAPASATVRMSGSLTISSSGTPERLKSTRLVSAFASWMFFPCPPHVDAGQADAAAEAVDQHVEVAAGAERQLVHADLVPLHEVRVEVVLAREARERAMAQLVASPRRIANSITRRFNTGSRPGMPRQTGQTLVLARRRRWRSRRRRSSSG